MKRYTTVLSIAGSDSSGGAGIQADLKAAQALGVFGMTAITAITAQNTQGVTAIQGISPDVVGAQIDAVFNDINVDAVKIGMLFDTPIIEAVADHLEKWHPRFVVLDPVMISTSGSRLISEDAIATLVKRLLPLATVVTPNRHEAAHIAGCEINSHDDACRAAKRIIDMGAKAVLVKGGHFEGNEMTDLLLTAGDTEPKLFSAPFVNTTNTHGTGCTLSTAIACHLTMGYDLPEAVRLAKAYLSQALAAGANIDLGKGCGPVNHAFNPQNIILKDENNCQ